MGKARVQGSNAQIFIVNPATGKEVFLGEYTKCNVKDLGELKKKQSLGQQTITSQYEFRGYDIELEGDKVDWQTAQLIHSQQKQAVGGGRSPQVTIRNTVKFYNGQTQSFDYPGCTLHGFEEDFPSQNDVTEKLMAFCGELKVECEADGAAIKSSKDAIDTMIGDILGKMSERVTGDTGTGYVPAKEFN